MSEGRIRKEENRQKQVKFRAPGPLVEAYDEATDGSRADSLREHMRDVAGDENPGEIEAYQKPEDTDMAAAYHVLSEVQGGDGHIVGERAKRAVAAQVAHCDKDDAGRILGNLQDAGYLSLDWRGTRLDVYVRPWSLGRDQ